MEAAHPEAGRNAMKTTFSLGRISGIRIGVNWSVLLIVVLLAYGLTVGQFLAAAPRRPAARVRDCRHSALLARLSPGQVGEFRGRISIRAICELPWDLPALCRAAR
jgi:hypothetical protein